MESPGLASDVFDIFERQTGSIALCVLPDHVHWVREDCVHLTDDIRRLKSYSTHVAWKRGVTGRIWQTSFFDRLIRSQRDLRRVVDYVRMQPVKHGLANVPEDYPYLYVRSGY